VHLPKIEFFLFLIENSAVIAAYLCLAQTVHDVFPLWLANGPMFLGRIRGTQQPNNAPNNANNTKDVENGGPTPVEAMTAQQAGQWHHQHIANLGASVADPSQNACDETEMSSWIWTAHLICSY
jgi:hypothetical protein